jgi:hypothetical protein
MLCDERMRRGLSSGRMHLGESDTALRSARWTLHECNVANAIVRSQRFGSAKQSSRSRPVAAAVRGKLAIAFTRLRQATQIRVAAC